MARLFAVFAFGMLHQIAGDTGMGAIVRSTGWRCWHVLLLPEIIGRRLLAGNDLCLVLPFDDLFCPVARLEQFN